jgi:hypothetical protein
MTRLWPLIVTLFVISCSTEIDRIVIDQQLSTYINTVKEYCTQYKNFFCYRVDKVSISFKDKIVSEDGKTTYGGYCHLSTAEPNGTITINSSVWSEIDEIDKELLVLHEYGHCAFGFSDLYNSPELDGIMYYAMIGKLEPFYTKEKDKYLNQFFRGNDGN